MKWRYHFLVNVLVLLPIVLLLPSPVYIDWCYLLFPIAAISGHLPDFDVILMKIGPWVHRDVFWHSFIVPAIATGLSLFFFINEPLILYSVGLFNIGYGVHLLVDFFPKMELAGFGLIHVWSDAKSESWSIRWLTVGFILSAIMGAGLITFTKIFLNF